MSLREIPEQYAGDDKERLLQVCREAKGDTEFSSLDVNQALPQHTLAVATGPVQSTEEQEANNARLGAIMEEIRANPGKNWFRPN